MMMNQNDMISKQSYYNQFLMFSYIKSKFLKMILNQNTKNQTLLMNKYT